MNSFFMFNLCQFRLLRVEEELRERKIERRFCYLSLLVPVALYDPRAAQATEKKMVKGANYLNFRRELN